MEVYIWIDGSQSSNKKTMLFAFIRQENAYVSKIYRFYVVGKVKSISLVQ